MTVKMLKISEKFHCIAFLHDKIKSERGFIIAENKNSKVMQDYEKVNRLMMNLHCLMMT